MRAGLHVLPGAIDVHVHFRDPGYPHKEDLAAARRPRRSAASPPCSTCRTPFRRPATPEILAAKHKMAAEKAHVDFGLYALLGEDTIEHVPELAKAA